MSLFGLLPSGAVQAAGAAPGLMPAQPAAAQPFVWGAGGGRFTPDELKFQRQIASRNAMAGMDTSPVGHWTQGAARLAQSVAGALSNRRLDRAAEANAAESRSVLDALMAPDGGKAAIGALANPYLDDGVRNFASTVYERANPKPVAPHYWETNNGSLGVIGPDGKPTIAYRDPDPKMNFIPDGLGGGQWVAVPTMGGGGPVSPMAPTGGPAVGTIEGGYRFKGGNPADQSNWEAVGGAPSQGGATFR